MYYKSGKSNVEADTLSQIAWDQVIQPGAVKAIMKAMVERPEAFIQTNVVCAKVWEALKIDPTPIRMTLQKWAEAQKADPVIGQVIKLCQEIGLDLTEISGNA